MNQNHKSRDHRLILPWFFFFFWVAVNKALCGHSIAEVMTTVHLNFIFIILILVFQVCNINVLNNFKLKAMISIIVWLILFVLCEDYFYNMFNINIRLYLS